MSNILLSVWHASSDEGASTVVMPDGCRDLIMKVVGKRRPEWFVSPLFDQAESVFVEQNSVFAGFRLRPGVSIRESQLLTCFESKDISLDEVEGIIEDFTSFDCAIDEALACLASDITSIKQASVRLGVSTRTLQRLILSKTNRPPGYWFQLARARKAAKSLNSIMSLSDIAEQHGFSDQSHMNREFQRWFKTSPGELLKTPELIKQLNDKGYG